MAIVQISKIIHRVGANIDLPQLDTGEIGFASDTQQVYIGNDPVLVPVAEHEMTTQTEILTEVSEIPFTQISGSSNTFISLNDPRTGQILVFDGNASVANSIVNWTGANVGPTANTKIKLGDAANISILGGMSGGLLSTDGQGNLIWTTSSGGGTTLPTQPTHSGQFLSTNGTSLSWATPNNIANATYANSSGSATTATNAGHVTSNAQANITSVGTLSSLAVSNTVTVGKMIISAGGTPPTHSYGAAGDTIGTIAFDNMFMYYCRSNYVDNTTDIWTRVALDDTSF